MQESVTASEQGLVVIFEYELSWQALIDVLKWKF